VRADSSLAFVLTAAGVLVSGIMMAGALTADMILTAAPPERAGAASALSETGSELGGAFGMAILGSIGAAVYHHQMARAGAAGLPPEALRTARETLGGAAAVAARLPGQPGAALLDAARHAFTHGMNIASIGGAIVAVVAAVLAIGLLRRVPVGRPDAAAAPEDGEAALTATAVHSPVEN
jgi:DHA2 family multidrug resistance protein-like MFS transporter